MPSADFAAAQARLLERRQQREAAEQARRTEQEASRAAITTRLPFPFRNIGDASLSVWDSIKGREGTRPAFRVGQVDAELLDEELLELMKAQVGEALKYYGVSCFHYLMIKSRFWFNAVVHRLIFIPTTALKYYSPFAPSFSNSRFGITMPHMARHCKVYAIPMQESSHWLGLHRSVGRSRSTDWSL